MIDRKFLFVVFGALFLWIVAAGANAETVNTYQDTSAFGPYGQKITTAAFSAANPQVTGAMRVDTKRTICFDVSLVDANASITSIDMTCTGGRTVATVASYTLPVYTATSVTGVTSSMPSTIRQTSTAGLAPGTSGWAWCVTNIPTPYIQCGFLANGVITAAVDTIDVYARGITP